MCALVISREKNATYVASRRKKFTKENSRLSVRITPIAVGNSAAALRRSIRAISLYGIEICFFMVSRPLKNERPCVEMYRVPYVELKKKNTTKNSGE